MSHTEPKVTDSEIDDVPLCSLPKIETLKIKEEEQVPESATSGSFLSPSRYELEKMHKRQSFSLPLNPPSPINPENSFTGAKLNYQLHPSMAPAFDPNAVMTAVPVFLPGIGIQYVLAPPLSVEAFNSINSNLKTTAPTSPKKLTPLSPLITIIPPSPSQTPAEEKIMLSDLKNK